MSSRAIPVLVLVLGPCFPSPTIRLEDSPYCVHKLESGLWARDYTCIARVVYRGLKGGISSYSMPPLKGMLPNTGIRTKIRIVTRKRKSHVSTVKLAGVAPVCYVCSRREAAVMKERSRMKITRNYKPTCTCIHPSYVHS